MKKEWAAKIKTDAIKNATTEYLTKWLADNQDIYEHTVKNQEFNGYLKNKPLIDKKTGKYIKPKMYIKVYEMVKQEIENRHNETLNKCENMRKSQQNDAPVAVEEKTIPNMAEKTEPDTSKTAKTNVKKVLHKNRKKPIDKPKKNNYITNTIAGKSPKTKTTKKRSNMENTNTKNTLTKKQLAAYETVYHHIWRTISNTIPMNNKKLRSAGFEQARIETIKLLKKIY